MVATGIAIFVLGAAWELSIYLSAGWPTVFPWGMMVVGLLITAVGSGRKSVRAGRIAWGLAGIFVAIILGLWGLG